MLKPIALIGLILIQVYWIRSAIENKEEAFLHVVSQVLVSVSEDLEKQEMNKYVNRFIDLKVNDSLTDLKTSQIGDLVFIQENKKTKETLIYKHGVLEEDYDIPFKIFNLPGQDTTMVRSFSSKKTMTIIPNSSIDGEDVKPKSFQKIEKFTSFDKLMFEQLFREIAIKLPINERITSEQLEALITQEFKNRGIDLKYEYAIYDRNNRKGEVLSSVRSKRFNPKWPKKYHVGLFKDDKGKSPYELVVSFPKKQQYLLSSVFFIAFLALVFTVIIVWIFVRTFIQLRTQKQISEMKTDFINNMTHEFKTPIATINLVLDAMKNPKVIQDQTKVNGYLKMLRDENRRMHAQVENVLQISKLDKNQLDIEKEPLDVHGLIENAIMHVQLLVEDREGQITKHLEAENTDIMGNELHFTNVLVNVLENAIKYSPEAPVIDIFTQVVGNHILIKVQDKGAGMNKEVLKKIFEKFYREHTGDIHNVKGHGLGLAYVKRIVKEHNGIVYAESEKGKGSIFYIKIPLIV